MDVDDGLSIDLDMEMESNTDLDEMKLNPSLAKSAFEQTTESLLRLGSISLDRFQLKDGDDSYGEDNLGDLDVPFNQTLGHGTGDNGNVNQLDVDIDIASVSPRDAPKVLRELSRKLFGGSRSTVRTEPLKYEVLEERASTEAASPKYSCILTVFRPTGTSRSYRTKAEHSKSSEAKAAAAYLALRLNALEFMKNGDKSRDRMHLVPLGKLGTGAVEEEQPEERDNSGDLAILDIENCCTEWRSGAVHPQWVYLTDNRFIGSFGCALKISLSAHVQRAYSVVPGGIITSSSIISYPSKSHAKSACAKLAITEGVLEFIKHGDGLEQPVQSGLGIEHAVSSGTPFAPATVLTLQAFYDSLPKPMPDSIGTKMNGDFNVIPWLNNIIQMTKGSRMTSSFHWYTDPKVGLHGCLLRLTRPDGPSKTYMVEANFSKRSDAKVAVCLWACSQGLGTYAQQVAAEIDSLVTPEMRRRSMEELLPALGRALHKIRPGLRAEFSFVCDFASFSCTLTIDLSTMVDKSNNSNNVSTAMSTSNASPSTQEHHDVDNDLLEKSTQMTHLSESENVDADAPSNTETSSNRTWITRTKTQYKTKQDARIAAVCLAFEEGVMQWVEKHQNLGESGEGRARMGTPGFSPGKGLWNRGRRGFERGFRKQAFGKGFGRGRGGFYGGYRGIMSSRASALDSGVDATNANGTLAVDAAELEEGEMFDGFEGTTGSGPRAGGKGLGFRRGRGGPIGSVPPHRPGQKNHQIMPHINPRFYPHISGVPASSYASYQPPPPMAPHAPPPLEHNYNAYYNSGAGYDFESEWYEGNGYEYGQAESPFQLSEGYIFKHARNVGDGTRMLSQPTVYSGNGSGPSRQRPATQSAHYGTQLDSADTASDAAMKPQLLPLSVDADKGGADLEEANVVKDKQDDNDGKDKRKGKGKDEVAASDREDGDFQKAGTRTKDRIEMSQKHSTALTSRRIPGVIPSNPRAMRNGTSESDPQYGPYFNHNPASAPSQPHYPSDYYYGQPAVPVPPPPPPLPEYPTGDYQYPYSYQQHRPLPPPPPNYQPYDYYYQPEVFPPAYNAPHPGYPGPYASHLHPSHSTSQPNHHPYSRASYLPTRTVGFTEPIPPSGPRALLSRQKSASASLGVQSEGRQPPSAPKAMLQKLSQTQQGRLSGGKQKLDISEKSEAEAFFPSRKRPRGEDTSQSLGLERKRLKAASP